MNSKKTLYTVILFVFILPITNAYQELHEPDIVYIAYRLKSGVHGTIGMYESVSNTLIKNMGADCFQESIDPQDLTKNKKYLLLDKTSCNSSDALFSRVLEYYDKALNMPPEETIAGKATKGGYVRFIKNGEEILEYLSVEVNRIKKIIIKLNI